MVGSGSLGEGKMVGLGDTNGMEEFVRILPHGFPGRRDIEVPSLRKGGALPVVVLYPHVLEPNVDGGLYSDHSHAAETSTGTGSSIPSRSMQRGETPIPRQVLSAGLPLSGVFPAGLVR